MNRLSPDNFCEFITPDLEVQITTQFILYKNPQGFFFDFFSISILLILY